MIKRMLFFFLAAGLITACNQTTSSQESSQEATAETHDDHDHGAESTDTGDGKHFGETIEADGAIAYGELLSRMNGKDSLQVKVTGTVAAVCQMKGCWMNIADEDDPSQEMFVQFKDYGFFMPKDIAGRQVVMEGYAYRDITSVEDLRHFAEDAGKSAEEIEAITEPREELKFLASGVVLLDEK